jgi:hypothetical protein
MIMANPSPAHSSKNISLEDDLSSHPLVEWLSMHRTTLSYGFLGLIMALVLASRFINWQTTTAEKDYFQAQTLFNQLESNDGTANGQGSAGADFQKLEDLMQRHSELKPKYEGALAQMLIINGQIPQADVLAKDIFQRTQRDHLQLYQDYTQASLAIAQGKYAEGLQSAKALETKLQQLGADQQPVLQIFNLVRLALLNQLTQQFDQEFHYWNQVQKRMRTEEKQALDQVLKIGQATLNQYMTERMQNITALSK